MVQRKNKRQVTLATTSSSLLPARLTRTLAATLLSGVLATSKALAASPAPVCDADYGGRMERLQLVPATDVFERQSVTLGKRFRFSAQYLPERAKLKTWVYELRERGPALLHAAEYPLPADACANSDAPTAVRSFGLNKVYSSDYERELFFQCRPGCD